MDSQRSDPRAAFESGPYVVAILITTLCGWFSLIYGVASAFQDLFSGPPPPESVWIVGFGFALGAAGLAIGIAYCVRRRNVFSEPLDWSTFIIGLAIAANACPIILLGSVLISP